MMNETQISIKLFSDFREAIVGFAKDVAALADIPKRIRKEHIEVIDEAMTTIDSALLLVILRLQDLLQIKMINEFDDELSKLDYWDDWLRIERDLRLCRSLRLARREMETLFGRVRGRVALRDEEAVEQFFERALESEGELADLISRSLRDLATLAGGDPDDVRNRIRQARNNFRNERNKLISDQVGLYELI